MGQHVEAMAVTLEDVTCAICKDVYETPKALPCLHTYCEHCIADYFKATNSGNTITCPECREDHLLLEGVAGLRNNFQVENMLKKYHQNKGNLSSKQTSKLYSPTMQVLVKTIHDKTVAVEVPRTGSVLDLKKKVEEWEGVPPHEQRLLFCGKQLRDNMSLSDYQIEDDSCVNSVLRLCGG